MEQLQGLVTARNLRTQNNTATVTTSGDAAVFKAVYLYSRPPPTNNNGGSAGAGAGGGSAGGGAAAGGSRFGQLNFVEFRRMVGDLM